MWGEAGRFCIGLRRPTFQITTGDNIMIKSALTAAALTLMSTAASAAQYNLGENVINIEDGVACKMTFKVAELRTPFITGAPLGSVPDDVYLKLMSVDDRNNPLCKRALNASQISMNAAANQLNGTEFSKGDSLTATVMYQQFMHGKMLYDEYHHVMVIEEGAGAPGFYSGLGLLP
jgi:hypothetical protein